ncbi:restriction endonuclease subunit S [Lactobacillus johnsonii]|uniref:restriction endonuclease subunit S n=1 Tax=Lactobacillus johnsonii TaxID=33959 RepID=UPI003CFC8B48
MNKRIFKNQTNTNSGVPFYKIGTFGKKADAFISKKLFEEYRKKYPYPKKGDLLISASGSIGRVIEYTGQQAYYQDSNIVWLNHNDNLENIYLKAYYQIIHWSGIEGSTIKRLYNKNILNTKIYVPIKDEQFKVGTIIDQIEKLITLQQRKVNNYFQYKTQLINTIFENKNWQMIKLKDVLSVPKKELANVTTKSQIMTVKLNLGGIVDGANRDTLNPSATKYYIRHAGQFIFGKQNFFNGSMAIVPKAMDEKVTSQDVPALNINNEKINSKFLLYYLSRKNFYKHTERFATGTGSKRLHVDTLLNLKIRIPDISYQNQIVSTLTLLDKKLQLETAKLNKLKQLKQFLLQNMFI